MRYEIAIFAGQSGVTAQAGGGEVNGNGANRFSKIAVIAAEDWFVLSHFRPLLAALRPLCEELVVVTRCSGYEAEIEALGARAIPLSFDRKSLNIIKQGNSTIQLMNIIRKEKPDVVHLIALNPIIIGSAVAKISKMPAVVTHITGFGYLGTSTNPVIRLIRYASLHLVDKMLRHNISWILAENETDLTDLSAFGIDTTGKSAILRGAGIDPEEFCAQTTPANPIPIAASISRLIHQKGLDILVAAKKRLVTRSVPLRVQIFARPDPGNPDAIAPNTLRGWVESGLIEGGRETNDVVSVWRQSDIAVFPARDREGMPRAMLEAAACARPLIVADVPGLKDFVRDGVEGLIVPPEDPDALATALERLANNPEMRERMGEAARARILSGYTDTHVKGVIIQTYAELGARIATSHKPNKIIGPVS